jgi:hypothetical protein
MHIKRPFHSQSFIGFVYQEHLNADKSIHAVSSPQAILTFSHTTINLQSTNMHFPTLAILIAAAGSTLASPLASGLEKRQSDIAITLCKDQSFGKCANFNVPNGRCCRCPQFTPFRQPPRRDEDRRLTSSSCRELPGRLQRQGLVGHCAQQGGLLLQDVRTSVFPFFPCLTSRSPRIPS